MTSFTRTAFAFFCMVVFLPRTTYSQQSRPDVLNYQINMDAGGIFNSGFKAKATLTCIKKTNEILILDLINFSVDSVKINDSLTTFSKSDSNLSINIPPLYFQKDTLTIDVFYQGIPFTDKSWGGFYRQGTYAYNLGVGFSSNPHNLGRAWFPCVDNFTDRATYTLSVTTGVGYTAVCGGLLTKETANPDGTKTWQWELNQPVPTYLASVAIGPYTFVKYEFTGMRGTIPVWLAAEPKDTANLRLSFAKLNNALQCFESRFGPYLFDRVGYVGVPFGSGAMEHASNIAYPLYAINGSTDYETLMAHELAHHWWGDLATCRTPEDMWLNEGWASFCEALFLECVYGKPAYINDMRSKLNEVLLDAAANDAGFRAVSGVPHAYTYGTHVYKKGALMVNTLRSVMGDTSFFAACKSYLLKHRFTDVSSINLRYEFQQHTTADLTAFFNNYIFEKGHYDVVIANWQVTGSTLTANLYEQNRFKSAKNNILRVGVTAHFADGTTTGIPVTLINGEGPLTLTIPAGKAIQYLTVDDEIKYALGHTYQDVKIGSKGVTNLTNTLLTINTQSVSDSAFIHVEHHWTGPVEGNIRAQGIRISTERYWTVRGNFPSGFNAWAFFNYNGTATGYLDEELFTHTSTEDSLVLLYRANENAGWSPISMLDLTFQPGGTPVDELGRFWLLKLLPGDYAFGVREAGVTGLKESRASNALSIFPNPADEELTVSLPGPIAYSTVLVSVYDMNGKEVSTQTIKLRDHSFRLSTQALPAGNYLVCVSAGDEKQYGKFVKK